MTHVADMGLPEEAACVAHESVDQMRIEAEPERRRAISTAASSPPSRSNTAASAVS